MVKNELSEVVERFGGATATLIDADLERPWAWRMYDEGVRNAFFRTYEELHELASRLGALRISNGAPRTPAQHGLAQYHAAYRDLQALLLVGNKQGAAIPAEGEWPLWKFDSHLRQHTVQAEKTLHALGLIPSEALRLLRLVYNALAEVEGMSIGAGEIGQEACHELSQGIDQRREEVLAAVA